MSKNRDLKLQISCFILLALGLSACLPGFLTTSDAADPGVIHTSAAGTIVAHLTLSAGQAAVAQLTQMAQTTPGLLPATETPTSISPPTETPLPTATPLPPTATLIPPSATPLPPTETPIPCEWAQFVKDITIPDGTVLVPRTQFTKVWRIRNIGSCAWTANYVLTFVSGDRMQVYNAAPLPRVVYPGENVDLALDLIAPTAPGHYRGYWMLGNPYGTTFGIGKLAQKAFWVDVQVSAIDTRFAFDFAANACAATWRSSARNLPCPGDWNSPDGSVNALDQPTLETGKREDEPTLWTRPEARRDGWIMGVYPSYEVRAGDHFMADIGCLENSPGCDVTFHLSYQASNGEVQGIDSWREVHDGKLTRVDVDLSKLAGKSVRFILSVINNGKPSRANAFWLVPSIRNNSATLPPTSQWDHIPAVQAARQRIAQTVGVHPSQVIPLNVTPVQWSDTCLGATPPGQVCAPAIIPGYRIILRIGDQLFEAHTDEPGNTVYWTSL